MSDTMKIHKLYSNVIQMRHSTEESACFDIHAHMRGPVVSEDRPVEIRSVKWFNSYNELHETIPEVTFESDNPVTTFELGPHCRALIPTGMIMEIPTGFSGRIHPRSGIAWKNGVTLINAEGVIDSDYRNEVFVPLINTTDIPFKIKHGDRIAQIEIIKPFSAVNYITYTEAKVKTKTNRKGGFGSTGV